MISEGRDWGGSPWWQGRQIRKPEDRVAGLVVRVNILDN